MAQIFCRRLKIELGIVSIESRFSYDRLRFFPVSRFVSSTPFYCSYAGVYKKDLCWQKNLFFYIIYYYAGCKKKDYKCKRIIYYNIVLNHSIYAGYMRDLSKTNIYNYNWVICPIIYRIDKNEFMLGYARFRLFMINILAIYLLLFWLCWVKSTFQCGL